MGTPTAGDANSIAGKGENGKESNRGRDEQIVANIPPPPPSVLLTAAMGYPIGRGISANTPHEQMDGKNASFHFIIFHSN
jgi:hypothetical protein